jgi:putative oxygen-independent coproporphyrinogen III oxidase
MTQTFSLYIHFPWCVKKCPYCDFNSHTAPTTLPSIHYIEALMADFKHDHALAGYPPLKSIFMGGGTPSLFSAAELAPLFDLILPHCQSETEITLEANPGTIEHGQFLDYHTLGINRISLGVQSFNARHLKALGRIHQADEVFRAVDEIKAAGFKTFNLDLMHGLPDQQASEALADLKMAIQLEPTHLSWYELTLEPNTYFARHPPTLPDESTLADIETQGLACLTQAGFERYEVSAFAKRGHRSRHNLHYWNFGDYLGIGAGAQGKISRALPDDVIRTAKPKLPKSYLALYSMPGAPTEMHTTVPAQQLPAEFLMNALRLVDGFEPARFTETTGLALNTIESKLNALASQQLIQFTANKIKATPQGARYLNEILLRFLQA